MAKKVAKPLAFASAMAEMETTDSIGARALSIVFDDAKWTDRVDKKRKLVNNAFPDFRIIRRSTSSAEVWLVAVFPPHIPPLTFRTLINLDTKKIGQTEDPFIPVR